MDIKKGIIVSVTLLVILFILFYLITHQITKSTGYSIFSKDSKQQVKDCLKNKKITLYINSDNPGEILKEMNSISYLDSVNIFDCAYNSDPCIKNNINFFPTFVIENNKIKGDLTENKLFEYSKCKF